MISTKYTGLSNKDVKQNREKFGVNTSEIEIQNKLWGVIKEIVAEPLFIILVCTALIYLGSAD